MRTITRRTCSFGLWSNLDSIALAGRLGRAGYDYVCLDLQHGLGDLAGLQARAGAVREGGSHCVVRVPWNRPEYIMRALDLGADSVIVPMVNSVADAQAAVTACRYLDGGARSWGPLWGDQAPGPDRADAAVQCFIMIETAAGLAEVEEIASVPGLDGMYIGPNDLALSTGRGRATYRNDPVIEAMLERIVTAGTAAGIVVGLHCDGAEMATHWAGRGVSMLTCATDTTLLEQGLAGALTLVRTPPGAGPSPA